MHNELDETVTELKRRSSQHTHDIEDLYTLADEIKGEVRQLRIQLGTEVVQLRTDMEKRFDSVEKRFDSIEKRFSHRFDGHDRRFEGIESKLDSVLTLLREGPATA
ncbi:hypothetical protein [Actinophytocola sediminis]